MYIYLYIYLSSDLSFFLCMYVFFLVSYLLFMFFSVLSFLSVLLSISIYLSIHPSMCHYSDYSFYPWNPHVFMIKSPSAGPGWSPATSKKSLSMAASNMRRSRARGAPGPSDWAWSHCRNGDVNGHFRNRLSGGTYHKAYVREYPHKMVLTYLHFRILEFPLMMAGIVDGIEFTIWLVVYLPLWKIWVRQLGWWNYKYMEKWKMFQTNNQLFVLLIHYHHGVMGIMNSLWMENLPTN